MATVALYGSGEFLPWSRDVDGWCLARAPGEGPVLILPTASAPEGGEVFGRWGAMGVAHYEEQGLPVEVLDLRARDDAERDDLAERIGEARMIFFSGGNPGYLAETMRDTAVWRAIVAATATGVPLAGCSAGAVFLGAIAPYINGDAIDRWVEGTRLLPRAYVAAHFDVLDRWQPGLRAWAIRHRPEGCTLVGIDEDTALCGDGERWDVLGEGGVWLGEGDVIEHRAGERVVVRLHADVP